MDGDTPKRLENGESVPSTDDGRIRMWTVGPDTGRCEHPPPDVVYTGEDGLNLYFECERCGSALVAQDAVHLLGRRPSP